MSKVKMPDPVGANMYVLNEVGGLTLTGFTVDQMESYAAAKVREALEEAAKVCDAYWKEIDGARRNGNIGKYIEGALDCADILEQRIRALIQNQTGDSNVETD